MADYQLNNTGQEIQERLDQVPVNEQAISELETSVSSKADAATTLEGYGIEDAYTKGTVDNMMAALTQSNIVVGSLPETGEANTIYRVPGGESYTDWMYYDGAWVELATYSNAIELDSLKTVGNVGEYHVDSNGNVAMKYDNSGLDFARISSHAIELIRTAIGQADSYIREVSNGGFYIVDSNGNIAAQYNSEGLDVAKVASAFLELIGIPAFNELLNKQKASGTTYNQKILLLGDSLTQGQGTGREYGAYLADKLPSYTITNKGEGGERIQDLMARMNVKFAVTASDVTIPASGSVNIGALSSELDGQSLDILKQNSSVSNPVMFHGVAGTIARSGSSYTFTRTTAGETAISAPSGSVVYMNEGMNLLDSEICILWIGQNGLWQDDVDVYVDYIRQLIAALKTEHYIVIAPTNRNYNYDSTTYCHYRYAEMLAKMTAAFGDHYLDMLGYLCTDALSDAGITPTEADETAIADYLVPPSLLYDSVHFNAAGYEVVAGRIYKKLETLKYI